MSASDKADETGTYSAAGISNEIRQAEIMSNVARQIYTFRDDNSAAVIEIYYPYVIVLSQDCDLLRDYEERANRRSSAVNGILLYEARPAAEMKQIIPPGRDVWKAVIQNNHERYHYLEEIPSRSDQSATGIPDLIVDFRRFFTLSPQEIYRQIEMASMKRRCMLLPPYKEHLQTRAAFYFQRVTLPSPHQTPG
ncbi:hypothetical protein [Rhodopila sp.]|uniref:hypothetical protein n=1 Tax=Rhodopila sp. TaxID=2480087 RepID=UPI003D11CF97